MSEGQPVNKKRRGMLAFYVATGVVALLFVGFYFAWKPLRVRYAISRLERVSEGDVNTPGFDWEAYQGWSDTCLKAALNGNKQAMRAFMPMLLWKSFDRRTNVSASSVLNSGSAYAFAWARPTLFFDLLDERSDEEAKKVVSDIETFCADIRSMTGELSEDRPPTRVLRELAARLEAHLKAANPEVGGVARRTLAYVRRRFARELAEAEKQQSPQPPPSP